MIGSVMSTGGLTALAAKLLRSKKRAERLLCEEPKGKEK
jgi:hypothetical protein